MATAVELTLEGGLSLADVEAVADGRARLTLAPAVKARLGEMRARAEAAFAAEPDKKVYGLNTAFGSNLRQDVSAAELRDLQRNLILSHCACVGPPAPARVVRATMALRAASLARGRSIVRPVVVETLIDMVNANVTPVVPRYGTVSASGDLAPLSHIAAVLIGEGKVLDLETGAPTPTRDFLARTRAFTPITLEWKEGLALNNGCQYANAWGLLATAAMRRLIETAVLSSALQVQAMRGMGRPFRADLHALRPHPGSQLVARWVFELLEGYRFQDSSADEKHAFDGAIQDPYNLRCTAQVLGPCLDLIERAEATMAREADSVTDNPIDLNTDAEPYSLDNVVSGGHFHGMPIAVEAYGLIQAAGLMARLANLRCARIVDAAHNKGLGPQVRGPNPPATQSGLMIAEYVTAGLCNHIWGLAMPAHLMSISTDSGQEDHVSMAANIAMRAYEAAERLAEALAIEMAFARQAEHVRAQTGPQVALGKRLGPALEAIGEAFPLVDGDRELSWDVTRLSEHVLSGDIARASGYAFPRH